MCSPQGNIPWSYLFAAIRLRRGGPAAVNPHTLHLLGRQLHSASASSCWLEKTKQNVQSPPASCRGVAPAQKIGPCCGAWQRDAKRKEKNHRDSSTFQNENFSKTTQRQMRHLDVSQVLVPCKSLGKTCNPFVSTEGLPWIHCHLNNISNWWRPHRTMSSDFVRSRCWWHSGPCKTERLSEKFH
jgi:hypothetical protein